MKDEIDMFSYSALSELTLNLKTRPKLSEDEKTKLQTDNKHIEEIAREKYRMSKKGERVFKVIEKEEQN